MRTLTLVIPCYNEEDALPPLFERLAEVKRAFGDDVAVDLLFVDDGSSDRTAELLNAVPEALHPCRTVTHLVNRGLGAAIRTGMEAATGELVAMMDSDCTYDPAYLIEMLPMMSEGIDIVTGSEFHPEGRVENISWFRLVLSRGMSTMYRIAFWSDLYSFSCLMRIYRRATIPDILPESTGFLSCTEVLIRAHKLGYKIVEFPLTLTERQHGETKMKVLRTIFEHLAFILGSVRWKVTRRGASA